MASSAANRSKISFSTVVVALVRPVDLVDRHDRPQALLQRLGDDELGLRQRAFGGVDQHDGAVHHVQDALDLAAEIGVARRVDDVDARAVPDDRGALGEDGDAALALQVVAVHRALGTCWFSRKAPDCFSSASTSVVLPWSTWAMIAMLRRFITGCPLRVRHVEGETWASQLAQQTRSDICPTR